MNSETFLKQSLNQSDKSISCQYAYSFYSTCLDLGAKPADLLDILGHGKTPFDNPLRRFQCDAVLDMLHYAQRVTGATSIGLISGRNFRPATFQNVGLALISANSLRHALEVNAKFQRLTQEFGITSLGTDKQSARVLWAPYIHDAERMRPITEAVYAGYVTIGRWLLWHYDEDALVVKFRHKKPVEPDPCAEYFGCEIFYEQDYDCLEFKASLADAQLPQANPEMLKTLENRLEKTLIGFDNSDQIRHQVYQCIQHFMEDGMVSMPAVSKALGYTEATLTRRLKNESTSFSEVLQNVRRDSTEFYMQEGKKSLTEIAYALGYGDQSAFSRAYRKWHGKPPSAGL